MSLAPWGPGRAGVRDGVEQEWRDPALCRGSGGRTWWETRLRMRGCAGGWGLGSGVASKPRVSMVSSVRLLLRNGRCILEAMGSQATSGNAFPCRVRGKEVPIPHAWLRTKRAETAFKVSLFYVFSSGTLMTAYDLAEMTYDFVSVISQAPGYLKWHLTF